jgi:GDP-4-dehydro-6-deoxy-D-mannose reductase
LIGVRTLVTGASGFVGGALLARLVARLVARGEDELFALSRRPPRLDANDSRHVVWRSVDLRERAAVARFVAEAAPERVFHLAALANPGECRAEPDLAFACQVGGTAALLAAVGNLARVVVASTSQVYGRPAFSPVSEEAPLLARGPYARSKRAAEAVVRAFAGEGRQVVVARPFNHSGPGQSENYVLPALVAGVRRASARGEPIRTGNLFPRRDFLHVDDVLDAYELLAERGLGGSAYNVARGTATSIGELLAEIQRQLGTALPTVLDPARVRTDDVPEIVGDASRLRALGWSPRIAVPALVSDVVRTLSPAGRPASE